jgi:hypothetical protein
LTVKAGVTKPEEAKKCGRDSQGCRHSYIGVVLNGVDRKKSKYSIYYFGKHYGMDENKLGPISSVFPGGLFLFCFGPDREER